MPTAPFDSYLTCLTNGFLEINPYNPKIDTLKIVVVPQQMQNKKTKKPKTSLALTRELVRMGGIKGSVIAKSAFA